MDLKNNLSAADPLKIKFFNSASNKEEEHVIDIFAPQKQGTTHISKDLKNSLLRFCISEHIGGC